MKIKKVFSLIKDELEEVRGNIINLSKNEPDYSDSIGERLGHVLSNPGKQLRPAITLLCSNLFESSNKLNSLKMATAVELLHIATLIHDDTVDSADLRRGSATASNLWGSNVAVLLGDYIFASSAIFVCETGNIVLVKRFAETIVELSKGELIENIDANNFELSKEKYFNKTYLKTASLFKTSSFSGALIGNASNTEVKSLTDFGFHFGMGYQIQDDVIDIISNENKEGKPVSNDLNEGVVTLPVINYLKTLSKNNEFNKTLNTLKSLTSQSKIELQNKIIASGSIEKSLVVSNDHFNKALNSLINIKPSDYKDALIEIINYTQKRV
jgi:geranylgeranyl pyrophosphate synthase